MAKYIDCDAAIALAKDIIVPTKSGYDYRHRCIDPQDLAELPAADVVEVVRCKDCKYCLQTDEFEYWCDGFCSPMRLVRKEDFCSHGEYLNG